MDSFVSYTSFSYYCSVLCWFCRRNELFNISGIRGNYPQVSSTIAPSFLWYLNLLLAYNPLLCSLSYFDMFNWRYPFKAYTVTMWMININPFFLYMRARKFFFVDKNGKTEFFGDYEKFEIINDSSSYPADVLEANPDIETWEKVFGKVVESFSWKGFIVLWKINKNAIWTIYHEWEYYGRYHYLCHTCWHNWLHEYCYVLR